MYDPLVHAYINGKLLGGCLGIVLGICLIVLGSCLSACTLRATDVLPVPPVTIEPRVLPKETS